MADKDFPLFRQILTAAKMEVASWGGTLLFVYLPDYYRCADPNFVARTLDPSKADRDADPRFGIVRLVDSLDIDVIDIAEAFARHEDPLSLYPFREFAHFNASGHRHAAETIVESLRRNQRVQPMTGVKARDK
jgi:hypothetical protein